MNEHRRKYQTVSVFFLSCFLFFCTGLYGCGRVDEFLLEDPSVQGSGDSISGEPETKEKAEETEAVKETESEPEETSRELIYVQVCGAVCHPGVYALPADARVFEALQMAGGFSEEAATDALNQAGRLSDGDYIRIPTISEWESEAAGTMPVFEGSDASALSDPAESGQEKEERVNLNTADAGELMTIPGIGQTRADAILEYRDANGPFQSTEEIKKVSGIKDGLYQKIKDRIRV